MKNLILICLLFAISALGFSQQFNDIKKIPPIYRGKIMLKDGTTAPFINLKVQNDTVIFTNSQLNECKYPGEAVHQISKTGSLAGILATSFGIGSLFSSLIITSNWNSLEGYGQRRSSHIIGATAIGAMVGGVVGAFINKNKTIYKSYAPYSFGIDCDSFIVNEPAILLTLSIHL